MDSGIQQLLGIILTHLGLLLLLLLILLFFLLILLLLVFLIILFTIVITLLVLLVLLLFLLQMLAEYKVVTRLIIIGVQPESIFIGLNSFTIHLVRLTDDTYIMICFGLT